MPLCVQSRGSNSISLYDSRQREKERRFMPPTAAAVAARDINVGEPEWELTAREKMGDVGGGRRKIRAGHQSSVRNLF